MDFKTLIEKRYSVREYLPKSIDKELLLNLLDAARLAPSATNSQPWKIVVVQSETQKEAMGDLYHKEWFKEAPVYLVLCADYTKAWVRPFDKKNHADIDVAIATDHLTLRATELGLGTCWVCYFDAEKCKTILNIKDDLEPVAILTLGYPKSDKIPDKKRKTLEEIVVWDSF